MAEEQEQKVEAKKEEFSSPPAAARAAQDREDDPRTRLHELASEVQRRPNRRLLVEYLKARRALKKSGSGLRV